jgi:tetratricopeptide (TPR) repeat protein
MTSSFRTLLIAAAGALAVCAWTAPVIAQALPNPSKPRKMIEPPKDLPRPHRVGRVENLDFLFEALKVAPDETSAKHIENRIWAVWIVTKSDTANLLMVRAKAAMDADNNDLAIKLLDTIIEIKPDYTEAWNRRATVFFEQKDFARALSDIRHVLANEPRHFGALAGLGMIMQELGDEKRALEAFRRALEIHPRLERVPELVKSLTDTVDGRKI